MKRPLLTGLLICLTLGGLFAAAAADKEAVARGVFTRLVAARGEVGLPAPTLVFTTSKRSAARCEGSSVVLEEAAYDICAALPDPEAALAAVLAHELIHYYEGHGGGTPFGLVGGAAETYAEAEADYLGTFLAYLAGYPTADLMPRILADIYRVYDLPDTLSGYPTLAERQALARRGQEKMRELRTLFDLANVLTALERYREAAAYYEVLLENFPSREMHNNAGVVYARAALPYFQPGDLPYRYPLELDLQSRLAEQARSVGVDRATRDALLQRSADHFERARLLDPGYAPALVNLGTVHALRQRSLLAGSANDSLRDVAADRRLEAGLRAREAIRLQPSGTTADHANQLLGILAAEAGDTATAVRHFQAGRPGAVRQYNLTVLRGENPPRNESPERAYAVPEVVAGYTVHDLATGAEEPRHRTTIEAGGERMVAAYFLAPQEAGGVLLRHQRPDYANSDLLVYQTAADHVGTTAMGVRLGDNRETVIREYGEPSREIGTGTGAWLVYPDSRILFDLRDGKVSGWLLYAEP